MSKETKEYNNRLVELSIPQSGKSVPIMIRAFHNRLNIIRWAKENHGLLESLLFKHGGILLRGFRVDGIEAFETFIRSISREMMEYIDRATPRSKVSEKIYTATDYPPEHNIFLHNEGSFAFSWPLKIFFYCVEAPEKGGETPIADVRKVYSHIDPKIRMKFIEKKIMYVRNFSGGPFGFRWQDVFQTDDKGVMEDYCNKAGIRFEWKSQNVLRTYQIRPAVAKHPKTGEMVWFNHAAVLHHLTLEPKIRDILLKLFKEEALPNNTYYGDGSPIETSVLDSVREAYNSEKVIFPWRAGDILMLDNMLTAHGRTSYVGMRNVVVGMSDPVCWKDILYS